MRIICPGCDAQYEVPDDVIPEEGREVQCSNCGTTWLVGQPEPSGSGSRTPEPQEDAPDPDDAAAAPATIPPAPRRELDPKVASILRAEAQREAAARAAEARPEPLEIQTELGLTEAEKPPARADITKPQPREAEPKEQPARKRPTGGMTVAEAVAAGSRRGVLPDIEEINSTLRPGGEPDPQDDVNRAKARNKASGFRWGMATAILIFVIALLVYQFSPEIAEALPEANPWLNAYATWVDDMRILADAKLRELLVWLDDMANATDEQP